MHLFHIYFIFVLLKLLFWILDLVDFRGQIYRAGVWTAHRPRNSALCRSVENCKAGKSVQERIGPERGRGIELGIHPKRTPLKQQNVFVPLTAGPSAGSRKAFCACQSVSEQCHSGSILIGRGWSIERFTVWLYSAPHSLFSSKLYRWGVLLESPSSSGYEFNSHH